MNLKTMKQVSLLTLFSLLTACSTQNASSPAGQGMLSGQSIPGSQLIGQQNKTVKSPTKLSSANKLPKAPAVSNNKMRKIVLKAPVRPATNNVPVQPRSAVGVTTSAPKTSFGMTKRAPASAFITPKTMTRPAPTKPVVTRPYNASASTNNASASTTKAFGSPKPVVVRAPAKQPQSTMRRLTLNGSANFKSGSARLTDAGQTKLLALSLSLQEGNTQVTRLLIEGHTDSVGDAGMNQALSLKRANAVADYLAKQGGFTRSMMETVGLGESKPIGSNKTKKGRAQNRRVEIAATGTRRINR